MLCKNFFIWGGCDLPKKFPRTKWKAKNKRSKEQIKMSNRIQPRSRSPEWIRTLNHNVSEILIFHGLEVPEDILRIRIFDLLNLYKIDVGRAEIILTSLYRFLNQNRRVDTALMYREMSQPFSYAEWNKRHRRISQVTVADVVLEEDINQKAVIHLLDRISRSFYKSKEYNPRLYKYASVFEIPGYVEKPEVQHE